MENKNIIRTLCGCRPKRNNIKPHENFNDSYCFRGKSNSLTNVFTKLCEHLNTRSKLCSV